MALPKAYVAVTIQEPGRAILRGKVDFTVYEGGYGPPRDELLANVKDVDGLLSSVAVKVDKELFDAAPKLKVVSNYATGYDNIDVAEATKHGVMITNTPEVSMLSTADLAMTLMLSSARRIVEAVDHIRSGRWQAHRHPEDMIGRDVSQRTLGIVGIGRIGQEVAKRARGFDMKIIYFDQYRRQDLEEKLGYEYVELDELLKESDFVTLHCNLTEETKGLIGERELKLMKNTAILINAARGPLVDPDALYKACSEKWILGAGLDTYVKEPLAPTDKLLTLPNIITTPHLGASTRGSRDAMATRSADNLVAALTGQKPRDLVNQEVWK
jgi:glyoxylate reductase